MMPFTKLAVSCVSLCVIIGSCAVKVPQILKVWSAKSSVGVSELSVVLEILSCSCFCLYNYIAGHSLFSYGEGVCMLIECYILYGLIVWLKSPRVRTGPILGYLFGYGFSIAYLGSSAYVYPDHRAVLGILPTVIYLASRWPQVLLNYRQKHTGQLSWLTFALSLAGNFARIGTSIIETPNDRILIAGHVVGAVGNLGVLLQIYTYRHSTKALTSGRKNN